MDTLVAGIRVRHLPPARGVACSRWLLEPVGIRRSGRWSARRVPRCRIIQDNIGIGNWLSSRRGGKVVDRHALVPQQLLTSQQNGSGRTEASGGPKPAVLSYQRQPLSQRFGWHLAPRDTRIREACHSLGSALGNSRRSLCWSLHGTKSMVEGLVVAYQEKECSEFLSAVWFVSTYGTTDRASTNAAPTHTSVRTLSKVGVRFCRTLQTGCGLNR